MKGGKNDRWNEQRSQREQAVPQRHQSSWQDHRITGLPSVIDEGSGFYSPIERQPTAITSIPFQPPFFLLWIFLLNHRSYFARSDHRYCSCSWGKRSLGPVVMPAIVVMLLPCKEIDKSCVATSDLLQTSAVRYTERL